MTITWSDYTRWAHESGKRKAGPDTPDAERAALFHIWGLGLGGEFLEFVAEVSDWSDPLYAVRLATGAGSRVGVLLEVGDCCFYLARMYRDVGHERQPTVWTFGADLRSMARHVGHVVECVKKAYRSEGDNGLVRLSIPESETVMLQDGSIDNSGQFGSMSVVVRPGRRAEFGLLLDKALGSIESWLVAHGSSLSEVCEANVDKLVKRRKEGLISAQGERVSELGRAVRPEELDSTVAPVGGFKHEFKRCDVVDVSFSSASGHSMSAAPCGVCGDLDGCHEPARLRSLAKRSG